MSEAVFNRTPLWRFVFSLLRGIDLPLLLGTLALVAISLTAMYSSAYDYAGRFNLHARNMALALGLAFVVMQIPPQKISLLAVPLYTLGIALLLAVAAFGITKKGATRWVNIGVVVQPSELIKISLPLMLAWWFQKREEQLRPLDYVVAGALLLLPVGLILKQPDLGTALLVLMAGLAVIFFAGLPWRLVLPPIILGAVGILLLILLEPRLCADGVEWYVLRPYQRERVCTLLNPMRDPQGKGFHILQGMIAIGAGGLSGKGFMRGTQTHLEFIPERTTDFIFAVYSEEFGLLGNLLLLGVYLFLIWRMLWIAAHAQTAFSRLLAGAIGMIFFTYVFVNMGMVSGILPVVGVPLPFISYGGTAMLTLGLALGMVFAIGRENKLQQHRSGL
ncbi:MAG: rod shape-determining protein RodA [Brachymonas sp.]|nr:rod shape-determining protein RodA [Brachymonas sp.]MDO4794844.1 rod shape-determining protein RodA [Brachymonas sp.]